MNSILAFFKRLFGNVPIPVAKSEFPIRDGYTGPPAPPNAAPAPVSPNQGSAIPNPNGANWADKFNPPPPPPVNPNGTNWYYKYAPQTQAPSAPQTVPVTTPVATPVPAQPKASDSVQFYQAIQGYNNNFAGFKLAPAYSVTAKGVVIHKIDEPTAMAVAARIKAAATAEGLDYTFTGGCLGIESLLDPQCENGNFEGSNKPDANGKVDPLGFDMGIAQLKLRYLVGVAPGCTDAASAKAFAFDIDKAIPYHCSLMAGKLLWAENVVQQNTSSAPDPRFQQFPLLLATGAYNFGNTGMLAYYESGQFPSHCQQVADITDYLRTQMGLPKLFPGVSKP